MNHVGNQMMLLEHKSKTRGHEEHHDNPHDKLITAKTITVTGNYDPLKNTRKPAPVQIHDKYYLLISEEEDDDDSEDNECQQIDNAGDRRRKKASNPNRRQRRRSKPITTTQHDNDTTQPCEVHLDDNVIEDGGAVRPPWRRTRKVQCTHQATRSDEAARDAGSSHRRM